MSRGSFSGNVIKLAAGNSIAQLIALATVPIITRLYDPAQYGIFSIFVGIVALIVPTSTLQYHATIVLPPGEREAWLLRKVASNVLVAQSTLCLAGTIAVSIAVYLTDWNVAVVPGGVVWLIAPAVLAQGMLLIDTTWIMRRNAFGTAAAARIWESVIERLIGIGFGLLHPAAIILAAGKTLGGMAAWWYVRGKTNIDSSMHGSLTMGATANTGHLVRRYRSFAVFSSIAIMAATAARELPVILLGAIFGPVYAAYYALGLRVVNVPMVTVGDAIAKAFFQHAAVLARNHGSLAEPALRLVKVGILIAAPPLLLLAVHGQTLFSIIFGERWGEAGIYVTVLAPAYLVLFVARPIASLFDALELQKLNLGWMSANLVGRIVGIAVPTAYGGGAIAAVWGITAATVILQTGTVLHLLQKIGASGRDLGRLAVRVAFLLAPVLVTLPGTAVILEGRTALLVAITVLPLQIAFLYLLDLDIRKLTHRVLGRAGIT